MKCDEKMGIIKTNTIAEITLTGMFSEKRTKQGETSLTNKDTDQQQTGLNTEQDGEETRVSIEGSRMWTNYKNMLTT